jgi:hypothetical protein
MVLLCLAALGSTAQQSVLHHQRLAGDAYLHDLHTLVSLLESHHGGLTRYLTIERFHECITDEESYLPDSLTLAEAYHRLASVVDAIRDGHTWLMPSERQAMNLLYTCAFIPFSIEVSGTEMKIEQNFSDCNELVVGTPIISIDGLEVRDIVKALLPYFTADGYSLSGKLGGLESQFWWYYGVHFGCRTTHNVVYTDPQGIQRETEVHALKMNDRINDINEVYSRYSQNEVAVEWWLENGVGILKVSTFDGGSLKKYKRWFNEALTAFAHHGATRMVIDVRGNGGGREGVENLLLSCLGVDCADKYDAVCIRSPKAKSYKYIQQPFKRRCEDVIYQCIEFKRNDDAMWERRERYRRSFFEPKHPFTRPVSVLIDRNTFSGAAEFAALVKNNVPDVVLIGEETCGGYQGHTSGYAYRATLPHTGFSIHIPRVYFDLNVAGDYNGGVLPDIQVVNSDTGFDHVLDFALTGGWWLNPSQRPFNEHLTQSSR